ncbi:choline dehydrogenase [Coprinopsis cinerea okayama7|uniref:pyranose dehydrogenase (acceptor) n=1 Tax=Coprinopsis cinerea (strain Okayama-7 / 130 / ATCC MYA-4618 / FGSC 9003) TaxID=240176 RepID=A8NUQ9_COPC7|nr:choline dehydrogenase [Coprinopsis cinerea okayama7\|eukprot:XP_001836512.2 choline dehydrogenase [Coprinopsis cinerea okayama7\
MASSNNALAPVPEALVELVTKLHEVVTTHPTGVPFIDALSPTTRALLASSSVLAVLVELLVRGQRVKSLKTKAESMNKAKGGSGQYVDSEDLGAAIEEARRLGGLAEKEWEYDVIVVGGGTSGCALAARLSEDPNLKVLLLEAGISGKTLPRSVMPSGFGGLFWGKHVHQLRTEPQQYAGGKTNFWPRAKMLGGCSSINAQMAQYGAPGDFDEWATVTGDDSWAWKNFAAYFRKFERFNPHPEYPDVDMKNKGTDGPVDVGYFNTVTPPSKAFIKACVAVGIPFTPDFNGLNGTLGVSRNLTVATNATATRIIFDTTSLGSAAEPRAVGVEFAKTEQGKRFKVYAKRDVVVSGGAVHTPHLLMLSGVGPQAHLEKLGIHVVKNHPNVGQNLVDHPVIDVYFKDKHNQSANYLKPKSLGDAVKLFKAIWQYKIEKTGGPLAMNFGESAAFVRSDDRSLFPADKFPEQLKDSTSAANSPDLEFFSTPFAYKEHGKIMFDVHTYALHCYLLRPTSKGEVLLKSANPFVQPSVNPNYLQTTEDVKKLARGLYLMLKIAQTEPLASHLDATFTREDLDHQTHLKSPQELEELVRERVETVYHPTTTCKMAPEDKGGVVDTKLRVYGIKGLRVCDASIFPYIISGHTAGGCFAIAEKLADEMKAEYRS